MAIDSFLTVEDASSSTGLKVLAIALDILVDIEKFFGCTNPASEALLEGLLDDMKEAGCGSREVVAALKETEMKTSL